MLGCVLHFLIDLKLDLPYPCDQKEFAKNMHSKILRNKPLVVLFCLITSITIEAAAGTGTKTACTVNSVRYLPVDSWVSVTCSGSSTSYAAFKGSSGYSCPTSTAAAVDQYARFFQAALMSGRPVDIEYDTGTSGGCLNITGVVQK